MEYSILNSCPGDSMKKIHENYIKLCKQYHPDKYKDDTKMKEINHAYDTIKNNNNNNNPFIPEGFSKLGFDHIPTPDQYVRRLLKNPGLEDLMNLLKL